MRVSRVCARSSRRYSLSSLMASSALAPGGAGSRSHVLESLPFDNRQLRELPVDTGPNVVRTVKNATFARVQPTPVKNPKLVVASQPALDLLGLDPSQTSRPEFAEYFSGDRILPGAEPAAHCYCGHQFGSFAGQLGDGATMYLGEVAPEGHPRQELQFKGAGKTPFSRTADGRKVLRSSLREFLCSELMAALGVPTTRAGTVVTSDTRVTRDVFYTGDPIQERCTIITRIAPSFLRFGSLEVVKGPDPQTGRSGPSPGNSQLLETLLGYVCRHFYPHIHAGHGSDGERWIAMYREIVERTGALVAQWQGQGWCHGVLNTDNMSLLGLTLDYGPFGWMDRYDPGFICNSSDDQGRYSYENQPSACRWNCLKLGQVVSLSPAVQAAARAAKSAGNDGGDSSSDEEGGRGWDFQAVANPAFTAAFKRGYHDLMRRKLGLGFSAPNSGASDPADPEGGMTDSDMELVTGLLDTMHKTGADYTNTFRALASVDPLGAELESSAPSSGTVGGGSSSDPVVSYLLTQTASAAEMHEASKPTVPLSQLQAVMRMAQANPLLGVDMDAVQAEMRKHEQWGQGGRRSDAQKAQEDAALWADWLGRYRARLRAELPADLRAYAEARSASSSPPGHGEVRGGPSHLHEPLPPLSGDDHATIGRLCATRSDMMRRANPKYVLRNWVAHRAIAAAETGDYSEVQRVLEKMLDPFGLKEESEAAGVNEGADLSASHVAAPNTADEGSTRLLKRGGMTWPPSQSATTCAVGGGATGPVDYSARPPPDLLSLKVT